MSYTTPRWLISGAPEELKTICKKFTDFVTQNKTKRCGYIIEKKEVVEKELVKKE
jgi:hypothetical protein